MNKLDTLYELLEKSCHDIIQSEESWLSFLKTSGYLYNFNFTNQLLIYQQRPDAKACTDFETWNNRMNRWIKKGSKGIALIDDGGRYTKIRYVFDIADTRSPRNRELHLWSVQESFHKQLIDKIAKQFDMTSNDEDLGSFIKEIAKEQTGYYVDDYFKRLMKLKDGSLLESYEENELKNLYRNLLENSVAYSLMSRCDIETRFYFEADDFISIELFNTPEMLGVIGNSFQEESNSILNVISRITKELIIQNRTFENNNRLVDDKIEKMKGVLSMEQITYSTVGDYQMPNLTVDKEIPLGKYAMMKKKYLKEQQPEILFSLRVRNQLNSYLMETEKKANEMIEMLMKELLTKNPAPNKEIHQMEWVQHMNNLQKTAEEIILKEIIYN